MSERERPPRLCYACGAGNERGLHMEFARQGERTVCAYTPCDYQQGYPGRMHGGVVTTLIDETMGWAVYHAAKWGATARLNVRFRKPVFLDRPLRIEAWIVRDRARLIELRAEVRDGGGALLAEGDGVFMRLEEGMAAEMTDLARRTGRGDAPEVVP
ncbi:MAG TPA: PaaI family thioesterase [Steroidobacteraceae bacterium]|nr:PaaI family thioesterase [Steroidobacteraceae bacterium]